MMRCLTSSAVVVTVALFASCGIIEGSGGPGGPGGGGGIGISSFTQGFVFVRADDRNVYAADIASNYEEVAQLTSNGSNKHPSLSHNGRSVVFVHTDEATSASTVQTVLLAGGTPSTVLGSDADKTRFSTPVFSPDDSKIVFSYERGGSTYLGVVDTSGANFKELTAGTLSFSSPSFIDANTVLVAAGNLASGYTQIATVDVTSGTFTNVLTLSASVSDAIDIANRIVVSKDGTKAVFDGRVANNSSRIFVVDLMAKSVSQLTDHEGAANDTYPAWISSNEVTYSSDFGGNDQVYVISASAVKANGTLRVPSAIEPWFGP